MSNPGPARTVAHGSALRRSLLFSLRSGNSWPLGKGRHSARRFVSTAQPQQSGDPMATFDLAKFKGLTAPTDVRYQKRISELRENGRYTESIESAVTQAIRNIKDRQARSFVIYGEPQSGKTEMMIAFTARLLDEGHRVVIVLLNDSVQLLEQNLDRFLRSDLDPAPKKFNEILDPSVRLEGSNWVVFCKKNAADLQKLISKVQSMPDKVVIDDEADYATPNGKVNLDERTRINELVGKLLGSTGIYIGVTATPARLDVNNTFNNDNRNWIDFPPHPDYTGHDVFFPTTTDGCGLRFTLELMPDTGDDPKYLRAAFFSFLTNVAYLNLKVNKSQVNYSMLIHTSGKKADHSKDYQLIANVLSALRDQTSSQFARYAEAIFDRASRMHPGLENEITAYVVQHIGQSDVIVMNSNSERHASTYRRATSPASVFTIAIGGNIVSRGVTFDNLLCMFFTRDVKHRLQQDTYIQRARMFGSRGHYLRCFELHIPEHLYFDWQTCFVFHKLSLSSIRAGLGSPVWIENSRIALTSPSSIDKARVVLDSGEMSWDVFEYSANIEQIVGSSAGQMDKLEAIGAAVGEDTLPHHLIEFIRNFQFDTGSVAVHPTSVLQEGYKTADVEDISRAKGLMAAHTLEPEKFPKAIHHVKIFRNAKGRARVFYKYSAGSDKVRFYTRGQ